MLALEGLAVQYVPYVGDSKRAMDEYTSEIFMGGRNTIVMHNTCEDSLLAAPLILDLVLLAELCSRIQLKKDGEVSYTCRVRRVRLYRGMSPCMQPLRQLASARLRYKAVSVCLS